MKKLAFLLKLRRRSLYLYIPLYAVSRIIKKTKHGVVLNARALRMTDCLVRSAPL
ncbi:MAG: hypothetical protein HYT79_11065 [Elusimicrobia bacterium]|nr:hypothetical protein [Elusimicrobiota bacterium]